MTGRHTDNVCCNVQYIDGELGNYRGHETVATRLQLHVARNTASRPHAYISEMQGTFRRRLVGDTSMKYWRSCTKPCIERT
jgi:hypothetical protein